MTDAHAERAARIKIDDGPLADLKRPWASRTRTDREVTGAIELAFHRGYQAGFEARTTDYAKLFAICPTCKGERRDPDGTLCRRCNGTAQFARSKLRPGEKGAFE